MSERPRASQEVTFYSPTEGFLALAAPAELSRDVPLPPVEPVVAERQ
jgi:hypothetical protein